MNPNPMRAYCGRVKAVVLDWAGTTVDYGSFAPTAVLLRLFADFGVPITAEQARSPMGLMKRDHLRAIAQIPEIGQAWQERHGRPCVEADIDAMFQVFVPQQIAVLGAYADPIPGVVEACAAFRTRGLKIGSTTGYTRAMMEVLAPEARRRGYAPDVWVSANDVPAGRPTPWMMYQNAMRLDIYPMAAVVKIGDTPADIQEGLNAGAWTIGLAKTGNELGLTQAEVEALSPDTLRSRLEVARQRLELAGAHFVVDALSDSEPVLDEIDRRLSAGEQP